VKSSSSEPDGATADPSRPRLVVTGAAGMLGRAVVTEFGALYDVVPHDLPTGDLADMRPTLDWMEAQQPALIVHCAAWTDVDGCEADPERAWSSNAAATRNVALAARACDADLIHISTDYVFDGTKPDPYLEDDTPAPLGVYGTTKLAAEEHVRRHAPRAWIVRTSWLFGPGGRNFVRTIAGLLRERDVVRVVDDQRGAPTYTLDLARALRTLVEHAPAGLYHVTNAGACSWYELAQAIRARLASGGRVLPCSTAEFPRPARRPANSRLEMARWRAAGLPEPRAWTAALDDYLPHLAAETER
jgi:dTDP-4-dehydrorhamnose reductase